MTDGAGEVALSNLSTETRRFPPTADFAARANAQPQLYADAAQDRIAYREAATSRLRWDAPWSQVLDWSEAPFAKWFVGGTMNVAVNCLDRHVEAGYGDHVAFTGRASPGTLAP